MMPYAGAVEEMVPNEIDETTTPPLIFLMVIEAVFTAKIVAEHTTEVDESCTAGVEARAEDAPRMDKNTARTIIEKANLLGIKFNKATT